MSNQMAIPELEKFFFYICKMCFQLEMGKNSKIPVSIWLDSLGTVLSFCLRCYYFSTKSSVLFVQVLHKSNHITVLSVCAF